jgi:U3 small nucleolar RNA-associated protein 21
MIRLQRDNGLLAVASDDLSLRLFDTECPGTTLVRIFNGHSNRISDMCFSADGRWLLSAAMDCTVRVWDIPQGRCIDWFGVKKPVTSMSLSPTLNFLATTHVDEVGVFLWANKMQFSHVILHPPSAKPAIMDMPSLVADDTREQTVTAEEEGSDDLNLLMDKVEQLSPDLLTLSSLPQSQWIMLSKLDIIKARNKPTAPPTKPELAPFFLNQVWDTSNLSQGPRFVPQATSSVDELKDESSSRELLASDITTAETILRRCLREAAAAAAAAESSTTVAQQSSHGGIECDSLAIIEQLKALPPSRVDFELRSLGDDESGIAILRMLQLLGTALQVVALPCRSVARLHVSFCIQPVILPMRCTTGTPGL